MKEKCTFYQNVIVSYSFALPKVKCTIYLFQQHWKDIIDL